MNKAPLTPQNILKITKEKLLMGDLSKSLFHQPIFWISFLIISTSSLIFYLIIWNDLNPALSLTAEGVANLFNIYKIPVTIFALNVPVLAIISADFRSKQACKQIRLTIEQSSFVNYYKHKEEFHKILNQLENENNIKFSSTHNLYMALFTLNSVQYVDPIAYNKEENDGLTELEDIGKKLNELKEALCANDELDTYPLIN